MGELHLEIIVDRMMREFRSVANVGKPQVAYKETIRKKAEAGRQVHQADRWPRSVRSCVLTVEPSEVGAGILVVNAIKGGSVPREFIKPLEQGIKEAAGYRCSCRI
jgi:elongation factor G